MATKKKKDKLPIQYILIALLVAAAFLIGSLWTKVQQLEKGSTNASANTVNNQQGQGQAAQAPQPPDQQAGDVESVSDKDWVKGDRKSRIALIEYSDFQCPFCQRFHPTAQQIVDEYEGQVMWVYRHFPLDAIHPQARGAAEFAECAGKVGGNEGFWSMADKIFEEASTLEKDELVTLVGKAGLAVDDIQACLDSEEIANLVEEDYQSGQKAGVRGTPGNILLDTKTGETKLIPGALPFESMKQAIDDMLQKTE